MAVAVTPALFDAALRRALEADGFTPVQFEPSTRRTRADAAVVSESRRAELAGRVSELGAKTVIWLPDEPRAGPALVLTPQDSRFIELDDPGQVMALLRG